METPNIEIRRLQGAEIEPYVSEAARLRIEVFREYPYLYDGDADYERRYLRTYAASAESVFVLALHEGDIVGVSTGLPLAHADEPFRKAVETSDMVVNDVFYFGESVLDKSFRGHGIGHRFFDEREAFARDREFGVTAFFSVVRPDGHPLRPPLYRPLDEFWRRRGYEKRPDIVAWYTWKDIDRQEETEKPMVFWAKGAGK